MTGYDLPPHVIDAIRRGTAGSTVHWVGRPDWRRVLLYASVIWVFAVPWTVFSVGWTLGAAAMIWGSPSDTMPSTMRMALGIIFPLWGVPFIAIGCVMLGMPVYAARKSFHTAHVVTDDAVITMSAMPSGTVDTKHLRFAEIIDVSTNERATGFGTLTIHHGWHKDSDGDLVKSTETLVGIPEVTKVAAIVRARMAAATSTGSSPPLT